MKFVRNHFSMTTVFKPGDIGIPKANDGIDGGTNGVFVNLKADDRYCNFTVRAGVVMRFTVDPVYNSPEKGIIPFKIVKIEEIVKVEEVV